MPTPRRTQAERSETTRTALLAAARAVFTEQGYVKASRERICSRAGVSRGALDHHFEGKSGLFRAVFEELQSEQARRIAAAAAAAGDHPLERIRAGARAYVECALDPAIRRIVHVDSRAALGWSEWHAIHQRYGVSLLEVPLAELAGSIAAHPGDLGLLAEMLLAALTAAALHLATGSDPDRARVEAFSGVDRLLRSFSS